MRSGKKYNCCTFLIWKKYNCKSFFFSNFKITAERDIVRIWIYTGPTHLNYVLKHLMCSYWVCRIFRNFSPNTIVFEWYLENIDFSAILTPRHYNIIRRRNSKIRCGGTTKTCCLQKYKTHISWKNVCMSLLVMSVQEKTFSHYLCIFQIFVEVSF